MFCVFLLCVLFLANVSCDTYIGGMKILTMAELEEDGWEMVFKGNSGNGNSVYHAWISGTETTQDKPDLMKRSYGLHYRDAIIDQWSSLGIKLVKFAFYNTDRAVAYIIFDGRDSDMSNWFNNTRVIDSSWSDLTYDSTYQYFSIAGIYDSQQYDRRFYISRNHGSCKDLDHLEAIDSEITGTNCRFDNQPSYPAFIYSKFNSVDNFQKRMFEVADFLTVFIMT